MDLTLPMMRTGFQLILVLAAMLLGAGVCAASPITYNVNVTVGGGSVTGTVQTDGTIGTIGSANITAWNLNLNGLGASYNITDANSVVLITGGDVSATATDLLFNFSGSAGDFLLFQQGLFSGTHYYCAATTLGTCFQGASVTPQSYLDPSFQNAALTGSQIIGTVAPIPEPASLALFGAGLLGLGLMRRRRRAA
jgi:hypothetical protein